MTQSPEETNVAQFPPQPPQGLKVLEAINRVMSALVAEGISKDRKNDQQGYKFRGIDDIYNVLCGLLAANQLVIVPDYAERVATTALSNNGKPLNYVAVRGNITFFSTEDGSSVRSSFFGEAMDSADKATNKAMSAAFKYACLQVFCIPTEGDNDADATTHELASGKKRAESKTEGKPALPEPRKGIALATPEQLHKFAQFSAEPTGKKYVDKIFEKAGVTTASQLETGYAEQSIKWIEGKLNAAEALAKSQTQTT